MTTLFTRRGLAYFLAIDAFLIVAAVSVLALRRHPQPVGLERFGSGAMSVSSPAFVANGPIPPAFTCDGAGTPPPLDVAGVPKGTKTLALVVEDPDAPLGVWTHWVVWNLPPFAARIDGTALPQGAVEGTTSFGKPGYGGPCPPEGDHRYFFELYALSDLVALPPTANVHDLQAAITPLTLDRAALMGTYRRR